MSIPTQETIPAKEALKKDLRFWTGLTILASLVGAITFILGLVSIVYDALFGQPQDGYNPLPLPLIIMGAALILFIVSIIRYGSIEDVYDEYYATVAYDAVVIDKDIEGGGWYDLSHQLEIEGKNMVGETITEWIDVTHGTYERTHIGDPWVIED